MLKYTSILKILWGKASELSYMYVYRPFSYTETVYEVEIVNAKPCGENSMFLSQNCQQHFERKGRSRAKVYSLSINDACPSAHTVVSVLFINSLSAYLSVNIISLFICSPPFDLLDCVNHHPTTTDFM